MEKILLLLILICNLNLGYVQNEKLETNLKEIVLSAIKGGKSKVDTLVISNKGKAISDIQVQFEGQQSDSFKILSKIPNRLKRNDSMKILIQFQPDKDFVGLVNAQLVLRTENRLALQMPLRGMSTKGLEGKNEPQLSWVMKTLGYAINLGWDSLANHIRADLQGDELPQALFKKSGTDAVEMIPVARYSPAFVLPFGYYTVKILYLFYMK